MSGIFRSLQQPLSIVLAAGCVTIATPVAAQHASPGVQKSAVDAAARMGEYLRSLKSFEVTSDVTLSAIEEGQKAQTQMNVTYKVRRPDAFVIDAVSDRKSRRFIYDGRSFTVFAPKVGYFATVSAPATINQTAEVIYQTYGVALPLADLFYWGEGAPPADGVTTAQKVGAERIGGVETDHYRFGNAEISWQIWIERGSRPAPRRVVIETLGDPAKPTYDARLTWNADPSFAADTFTFTPAKDAKPIELARVSP